MNRFKLPIIGRNLALGIGAVVVIATGIATAMKLRRSQGSSGVRTVADGPPGYIIVVLDYVTLLFPESQRELCQCHAERNGLVRYTYSRKKIGGLFTGLDSPCYMLMNLPSRMTRCPMSDSINCYV